MKILKTKNCLLLGILLIPFSVCAQTDTSIGTFWHPNPPVYAVQTGTGSREPRASVFYSWISFRFGLPVQKIQGPGERHQWRQI